MMEGVDTYKDIQILREGVAASSYRAVVLNERHVGQAICCTTRHDRQRP